MPQPTSSAVHVNVPLSNFTSLYLQNPEGFVADSVFPQLSTQHQSNSYYSYDRAEWNRDSVALRAPGTESAGSGYTLSANNTYYAGVYSLHKDVDSQTLANYDAMLSPGIETAKYLAQKMLIKKEAMFASNFFKPGVWTTDWTGVTATPTATNVVKWSDYTNSTPIEDVRRMSTAIQLASGGYRPNKMTISRAVADVLADHPDILDRIKYTGSSNAPALTTTQALGALFGVEVLIADAIVNSAAEGATEVNAFINGKGLLLSYSPASVGLMTVSSGMTFQWDGLYPGGTRIKTFYMEALDSYRTEIESAFAQKVTGADLAGFIATVVA